MFLFLSPLCKFFKVLRSLNAKVETRIFQVYEYMRERGRKWRENAPRAHENSCEEIFADTKKSFSLSLSLVIIQNTRVCDDKLASKHHQNLHFKKEREENVCINCEAAACTKKGCKKERKIIRLIYDHKHKLFSLLFVSHLFLFFPHYYAFPSSFPSTSSSSPLPSGARTLAFVIVGILL